MKFGFKEFYRKTPAILIRIGNALVAAGTAVALVAALLEHEQIALIVASSVFVGRFLIQFFSAGDPSLKEPTQPSSNEQP